MGLSNRISALVIGLAAFSACGVAPAQAQQTTLRVHYYLAASSAVSKDFIEPWARKIESESKGRIKVELYPSMQLGGSPPQLFDQVSDGVVDIAMHLAGSTPGRFPKSEAIELPFISGNAEQTSQAAWDYFQKNLKDEFKDVHLIATLTHGPGIIHVKGKGVGKLEDMKGLKLRGPTRLVNRLLDGLGATPVGMPMPTIPDALSKGVIDGTVIPWDVTINMRVHEIVQTHTMFHGNRSLYVGFLIYAMNKKKYDSLPQDLKIVIDNNSGVETSKWIGRILDEADAPAFEEAKKRGNTITTLDAAETARWKEAANKVRSEWLAEMKKKNIDGQMLLTDMEAFVSKYAGAVK